MTAPSVQITVSRRVLWMRRERISPIDSGNAKVLDIQLSLTLCFKSPSFTLQKQTDGTAGSLAPSPVSSHERSSTSLINNVLAWHPCITDLNPESVGSTTQQEQQNNEAKPRHTFLSGQILEFPPRCESSLCSSCFGFRNRSYLLDLLLRVDWGAI